MNRPLTDIGKSNFISIEISAAYAIEYIKYLNVRNRWELINNQFNFYSLLMCEN